MDQIADKTRYFTVGQIARHCQVNRRTVHRWINDGRIKAYNLPSGHFRVKMQDLCSFLKDYNLPIESQDLGLHHSRVLIADANLERTQILKSCLHESKLSFDLQISHNSSEACFKIGLFQPDLLFVGDQIHGEFDGGIIFNLRKIEKLKHIKVVLVKEIGIPVTVNLDLFDMTLEWPFESSRVNSLIVDYLSNI